MSSETLNRRAEASRENGKKGGRPITVGASHVIAIRVPPEQFEWVRAHGGAKRIRALIAAAMRQEENR